MDNWTVTRVCVSIGHLGRRGRLQRRQHAWWAFPDLALGGATGQWHLGSPWREGEGQPQNP
jgi:hypothetical protein